MGSSIIKLFSGGRRLKRFWDNLELSLHEACASELAHDDSLTQGPLFDRLRRHFTLSPVQLGPMRSITIEETQTYYIQNGDRLLGHRASAHVPFTGSKVLLQSRPEENYEFSFRGRDTKHTLHLHKFLPDLDGREFAREVRAELLRIQEPLREFRSTAYAYDDALIKRIKEKIRTY
jgi:hypothetical protein